MSYTLHEAAYVKAVLHACKYPSASVSGVFLGTATAGHVALRDAVPLFHTHHNLASQLEIALSMVSAVIALIILSSY